MTIFSARLEERMNELGYSQSELARRANLPRMAIHNYLVAKYRPKAGRVLALAKALHVRADWLEGKTNEKDEFKIDFLNAQNLFLDNRLLSKSERTDMANFIRGIRTAEKRAKK